MVGRNPGPSKLRDVGDQRLIIACRQLLPKGIKRTSMLMRLLFAWIGVLALSLPAFGDEPAVDPVEVPSAIFDYMAREEAVFGWERAERLRFPDGGVATNYVLTSQTWQEIVWRHSLQIHEPAQLTYPSHMILFVTGGRNEDPPRPRDSEMGQFLAKLSGCRVAMLSQVPNQPLLGDRVEDDLITETWLKFLETGDTTWPLLFPMVKSAVQAMTACEQIAEQEQWPGGIQGFVISGASKRGWTSWLTPVVDSRVVATAPIVIDVLNFRPQMQHQLNRWGRYSDQIADYTSKGLVKEGEETEREAQLRLMMDPYTYVRRLSLPKLQINGTNDPYWVVDANQFYWNDLVGPKFVCQVPNAGHGLEGGRELAIGTLAAFARHVASGKSMPDLSWETIETADGWVRRVTSNVEPTSVRLWCATSDDFDFRDERWSSQNMSGSSSSAEQPHVFELQVPGDDAKHVAHYCELMFEIEGVSYGLCTTIESSAK